MTTNPTPNDSAATETKPGVAAPTETNSAATDQPTPRQRSHQSRTVQPRVVQSRGWSQHLIIVTVLVTILIGAAVAIRALGVVTQDSATGAEPSAAYHEALSAGFPLEGRIMWEPPVAGLKRNPTAATLERVATDWAAIWYSIDGLHADEVVANPRILIGDAVLTRLREHAPPITRETVRQTEHVLQVNYYSLDGAIIGLTARATAHHSFADSVTDAPLEYTQSSAYHAVVILTDGRWRLTSLQRIDPDRVSSFQ